MFAILYRSFIFVCILWVGIANAGTDSRRPYGKSCFQSLPELSSKRITLRRKEVIEPLRELIREKNIPIEVIARLSGLSVVSVKKYLYAPGRNDAPGVFSGLRKFSEKASRDPGFVEAGRIAFENDKVEYEKQRVFLQKLHFKNWKVSALDETLRMRFHIESVLTPINKFYNDKLYFPLSEEMFSKLEILEKEPRRVPGNFVSEDLRATREMIQEILEEALISLSQLAYELNVEPEELRSLTVSHDNIALRERITVALESLYDRVMHGQVVPFKSYDEVARLRLQNKNTSNEKP
ncbi:MAG: hypothetical protein JWQ35_1645 [Bacteriovoracaceae bacterium]|nr:hypothetical protein [Bacteriovoracaceae bacterium]